MVNTSVRGIVQQLVHIVSPSGSLVYVNGPWKLRLGYNDDEIQRMSLFDILDPGSRAIYDSLFKKGKKAEPLEKVELSLRAKDGELVTLHGGISCRFRNTKIICAHGFFDDVTGKKREEDAAKHAEPPYRLLVENAIDIISTLNRRGVILSLNPAFEKITGWKRDVWLGKTFAPLLHPDDVGFVDEMFQRVMQGRRIPLYESRLLASDGRYVVVETTVRAVYDGSELVGLLAVHRDVTERKRVEEELRYSEARFRNLVEAFFDGIVIHQAGTIVECNRQFAEMHGYKIDELSGKSILDLVAPESRTSTVKSIGSSNEISSLKTCLRRDGTKFMAEVRARNACYQGRNVRVAVVRKLNQKTNLLYG